MGTTEIIIVGVAAAAIVVLSVAMVAAIRSRARADRRLHDALERIGSSMTTLTEAMAGVSSRTLAAEPGVLAGPEVSLDLDEVVDHVLARAAGLPGVDAVALTVPRGEDDLSVSSLGLDGDVAPAAFDPPDGSHWELAEVRWAGGSRDDEAPRLRAALVVPLLAGGEAQGTLVAYTRAAAGLGDEVVTRLRVLANALAPSVANARRFMATLDLVTSDALTGLRNRRGYDEGLAHECERARRTGQSLALLVVDLDDFGQVNKAYGLQVGDAVLKAFATTMRRTARSADIVCRRGGEEFAIILPETGCNEARLFYARLRAEVDATVFPGVGRLTFSAGLTTFDPNDTPEDLDERASRLMTARKSGDKNGLEHDCA